MVSLNEGVIGVFVCLLTAVLGQPEQVNQPVVRGHTRRYTADTSGFEHA